MPSLPELQRRLATVFTHPRGVAPGLAAAGFGVRRPVTAVVADRPPIPLHTRLAVYSDGYFLRLSECLAQDFAAVHRALGPEDFQRLAADYLVRHPSRSPFINDVGAAFARFIQGHPFAKRFPFLPELATLERAVLTAILTDRIPSGDLSGLGPSSCLKLDPTVKLLKTRWAVNKLWENRSSVDGKGLQRLRTPSPRRLILYRDNIWVRVRTLEEREFFILKRLAAGKTLGRSLKGLTNATVRELQGWFARWMKDGILKGIKNRTYQLHHEHSLLPKNAHEAS